ncbi:MAG: aminoacetone oxidase family FAD-binding enzyme, partial [bacterium]|nr:aminoacetone oxidase family FAD-binding enzyme [bacterium]
MRAKYERYDVIIIGAGPAGLIAAIESFAPSRRILILEKMPKPALKLRISGKGRCNITNAAELKEFVGHFGKNGRFLRPAFSKFFSKDLLRFFEELGVQFKLERGGRYFPQSDTAVEVVDALLAKVKKLSVPLWTNCEVVSLTHSPGSEFRVTSRRKSGTSKMQSGKVLLATGGKSYPKTGSSGTGFTLASRFGHTITPLSPSLVPL